ncbi:MAG: hypothetical protein RDU76_11500 [Candidatus Edwardsbacteria bacterium]|nr:hypothetical protein [Candidatus Edwardsbacteria bacterium]
MDMQALREKLLAEPNVYEFLEEAAAMVITNKKHGVTVRATHQAIAENDWETIKAQTVGGRDVLHITRVTGYFTIVEGWNKGKLGELHDRFHSNITEG